MTEVNLLRMPQEQANTEPDGRAASIVTALLLFICVISVAFYTYIKSNHSSASPRELLLAFQDAGGDTVKEAQAQYSFDFVSKENPVFTVYKDYIIKISSGSLLFLDKKGEILWSESLGFAKPVIKKGGGKLLVADIGAGEICVLENKFVRWSEKLDVSVLNADISNSGYVTVITSSKRDNNEIRVFEPHGAELFRKIIANDFAVSAMISPSEKILAVSGIRTGPVGVYSNYKLYDLEGREKAEQAFAESGELLPIFWYNNDDSIFAVGDRALTYMNKMGEIVWMENFRAVLGASPMGHKYFAVAAEGEKGTQLKLYSTAGQELSACMLEGKPQGLAAVNGCIAVYTYDKIYFYNEKCKVIGKYSSNLQIKQVCFFNRQQASVITEGTVTIINMN